jgi:hypothetical protein
LLIRMSTTLSFTFTTSRSFQHQIFSWRHILVLQWSVPYCARLDRPTLGHSVTFRCMKTTVVYCVSLCSLVSGHRCLTGRCLLFCWCTLDLSYSDGCNFVYTENKCVVLSLEHLCNSAGFRIVQ